MSTAPAAVMPAALPARPKVNKWLVTVSISFGTLMGAIDSSIVNVALPHIRGAVGATVQEITWISTGYMVSLVLVMPLTAFLARLFGQKQVYLFSLVLFLVGSILCGLATSLPALVIYRVLQGLGAGALQPTEQAILRQTFPPEEQGMAMAVFGMAVMLGPAIGPTLGGYIVDNWHWSWIFFINLPVGLVGLVMVTSFVHEDEEIRAANQALAEAQRKNVDWLGIGLLAVGLTTLQYFLEEGQRDNWFESNTLTAVFLVSMTGLAAFVIRELTTEVPAVNLRLFKDPVFTSGTVIGGLMFAMLMANMFLLPLFMQELLGLTATQSGLALMPRVLMMMVAAPIVGRLYNHVSPRLIVAVGVLLFGVGSYQLSTLTLDSGSGDIIAAILIQGIGFACLFVPLTTVALSRIPRHKLADATGLNSLIRQVGGAIGLALFATVLTRYAERAHSALIAHVGATSPLTQERLAMAQHAVMSHGADPGTAHGLALRVIGGTVQQQSYVIAYEHVFLLAGVVFLFVLPLLVFLREGRDGSSEAAAHALEM